MTIHELATVRMAEELADANGNHRAAFISAIQTRGTDARTKQFKFMDIVIKMMSKEWAEELES